MTTGISPFQPKHIPLSYWRTKEYDATCITMTEQVRKVLSQDPRVDQLAKLDRSCQFSTIEQYAGYRCTYHGLDESSIDLLISIADELGETSLDDDYWPEATRYVAMFKGLIAQYVPELVAWSRAGVPGLPTTMTTEGFEELVFNCLIEGLIVLLDVDPERADDLDPDPVLDDSNPALDH